VNTPDGQQYTRDGAFALDPDGKLVTKAGNPVLTDAGSEIQIPPGAGALVITEDGAIRAGDVVLGKIGIFKFPEPQRLVPIGGNLYADGGQKAETVDRGTRVAQGYLESSNVRPVVEMTRLLEASRQYEAVTRSMRASEDLRSRAIERLGRPQ
jgi:flagellar basal-body rod protein FlgF